MSIHKTEEAFVLIRLIPQNSLERDPSNDSEVEQAPFFFLTKCRNVYAGEHQQDGTSHKKPETHDRNLAPRLSAPGKVMLYWVDPEIEGIR